MSRLRRRIGWLSSVLACLFLPVASEGASNSGDRVDHLFAAWQRPGSPGAVVAVGRGGKLLYARGYGYADLRFGLHNAPDMVYAVGSVSKQFTAYVVLSLAHEGKLRLDDDVHVYLPSIPQYGQTITLRELLQHTSGLRDYFELALLAGVQLDDLYTAGFVDALLESQRALNFAPGTDSAYTNTEYYLLAKVIEKVTGEPYPDVLRHRVFEPLGMTHSAFVEDPRSITPRLASSYWPNGNGGYLGVSLNPDLPGPSGLRTDALDLLKWEDNFDARAVGGEVLDAMMTRTTLANGEVLPSVSSNGIEVGKYRGMAVIRADGGIGGFRAAVLHVPAQRLSVIVLANLITFAPADLAEKVADIYLGLQDEPADASTPPAPKSAKEASTIDLQAYVGEYHSREVDASYDVCVDSHGLYLAQLRNADVRFESGGDDAFDGDQWWLKKAVFTRDASGRVDGMEVSGFRALRRLRYDKTTSAPQYCHAAAITQ